MKKGLLFILILLVGLTAVGCGEDVAALERNLYYDMQDFLSLVLETYDELIDQLTIDMKINDAQAINRLIDEAENKLDNLNPPKHVKKEVEEWQKHGYDMITHLRNSVKNPYGTYNLDRATTLALENTYRIYDGFKEFKP